MNFFLRYLWAGWWAIGASPAVAQVTLANLAACYEYAHQHNPDLAQARLNGQISLENQRLARAGLLPQLKASTTIDDYLQLPTQLIPTAAFGGPANEFRAVQFGTKYQWTASLDGSLPLVNANAWNQHKNAKLNADLAQARTRATQMEVDEQVARAYYLSLLAQAAVEIARQNALVSDSLLASAGAKARNGLLEPIDLNRIKANNVLLNNQLANNRLVLQKNLNTLKTLLGIDLATAVVLSEPLAAPAAPAPDVARLAPENYPQFLVNKINVSLAGLALRNERQGRLPQLSLVGRYAQQNFRNDLGFFQPGSNWFALGLLGLRLEVPVFGGLGRPASIQRAKLNLQLAEHQLTDYLRKTQAKDHELDLNYQQASQGTAAADQARQLGEANYRIARIKYANGTYSLDQLLNVHNELLNAQNQYLSQLSDRLFCQAALELRLQQSN
jgi:outer membrane protein TolC